MCHHNFDCRSLDDAHVGWLTELLRCVQDHQVIIRSCHLVWNGGGSGGVPSRSMCRSTAVEALLKPRLYRGGAAVGEAEVEWICKASSGRRRILGGGVLFVWLINHDRKYCRLICYERKTLLNGWQIRLISSSISRICQSFSSVFLSQQMSQHRLRC